MAKKEIPRLPPDTVCYCFEVTERQLRALIVAHDVRSVDELQEHCNAGMGCRTCAHDLRDLIARVRGEATE